MERHQWQQLVDAATGWTPTKYFTFQVYVEGHPETVGHILPAFAKKLDQFPQLLECRPNSIVLRREFDSTESRTEAINQIMDTLRKQGEFPRWTNETYAAKLEFDSAPLFYYDRGVAPDFGLKMYGTNLNGYVRDDTTGRITGIWIAKRSMSRSSWPGRLEPMVGGGLPADTYPRDSMAREAYEEAGLSPEWVKPRLSACDTIAALKDSKKGLINQTSFIYDVQMPRDMTPKPVDGEVESFYLCAPGELISLLAQRPNLFRPETALVLVDFAMRHKLLSCQDLDDFTEFRGALEEPKSIKEPLGMQSSPTSIHQPLIL